MKGTKTKYFFCSLLFIILFIVWTLLVCLTDVQQIGPQNTKVGLATINKFFKELIGENYLLYIITDWSGIIPIAVVVSFAGLGLCQLINRKSILKVDLSLIVLGGFYVAVFLVYILFEYVIINYRPVLIEGVLESSYPSSTTMLVICVMSTAIIEFNERIKNENAKRFVKYLTILFILFVDVGRIISGVHWISDIIGGVLISFGLVLAYCGARAGAKRKNKLC